MDHATKYDVSKTFPEVERSPDPDLTQMKENTVDVPFIPECEVFYEGGPDRGQLYADCRKNPGHSSFIPVNKFTMKDLPQDCQMGHIMNYIKSICDRTVKITVNYCSENRPAMYPSKAPYPYNEFRGKGRVTRCGTGYIENILPSLIKGRCPCHICKTSDQPEMEYLVVQISTAAHVIFDGAEASHVVCELFYDSDDSLGIKHLYGVNEWDFSEYCNWRLSNESISCDDSVDDNSTRLEKCYYDAILIKCVTHDPQLIALILDMNTEAKIPSFPLELIVSHPHGNSKQITFGKTLRHILPIPINHSCDTPFKLGPHTRCQLLKNAPPSSKEAFQLLSNIASSNLQGDVLTITETLTAFLPDSAAYVYQVVNSIGESHVYCRRWVQFPSGTRFVLGNGSKKDSIALMDVEFQLTKPDDEDLDVYKPFYVIYDIDTCPGCSGAPIMIMDEEGPYIKCHSGALKDGTNVSEIS